MKVIPAIDLLGRKCVRLVKGEKTKIISYDVEPIALAEDYYSKGAELIHVVDLDGAFTGIMKNLDIIKKLAKKFSVQVGGGIRSQKNMEKLLDLGVEKLVVSTLLMDDQKFASKLKELYYGKIVGSFDFKNNKLSYLGWTKESEINFEQASSDLSEIIITDTERDGTLTGPNLILLESIRSKFNGGIIAAGGIRDNNDLIALEKIQINGAIIGRALLDKKLEYSKVD